MLSIVTAFQFSGRRREFSTFEDQLQAPIVSLPTATLRGRARLNTETRAFVSSHRRGFYWWAIRASSVCLPDAQQRSWRVRRLHLKCQAAEIKGPPLCFGRLCSKPVSGHKGLAKSELFAAGSIGYLPIEVQRRRQRELEGDSVHFQMGMDQV